MRGSVDPSGCLGSKPWLSDTRRKGEKSAGNNSVPKVALPGTWSTVLIPDKFTS